MDKRPTVANSIGEADGGGGGRFDGFGRGYSDGWGNQAFGLNYGRGHGRAADNRHSPNERHSDNYGRGFADGYGVHLCTAESTFHII